MNREQLEKMVPKSYEDVMNDAVLGQYLMIMAIYTRLIEKGVFKDFDDVSAYQKEVWEKALRERIIKEYEDKQ